MDRPRTNAEPICSAEAVFPGHEYNAEQAEFLNACARYQQRTGKRFLRATDYLAVAVALGYRCVAQPAPEGEPQAQACTCAHDEQKAYMRGYRAAMRRKKKEMM